MISPEEREFYSRHSLFSDPGAFAAFLHETPSSVRELVRCARNVVFHEVYAAEAGLVLARDATFPPETSDPAVRYVRMMLSRITDRDPRSLAAERAKQDCFIGTCRDYALLLCSLLRAKTIPARVRCGFAFYFAPERSFGDDHWVTEYWSESEGRWILADPEIDPSLTQHSTVTVDPLNIPRTEFQTAGTAWRLYRQGLCNAESYGVGSIGLTGAWFMASNVIRDLAALNKYELAPFDYCSDK